MLLFNFPWQFFIRVKILAHVYPPHAIQTSLSLIRPQKDKNIGLELIH